MLTPGQPFALIGDITLSPGTAERAVLEFVCQDRVLLSVPRLFRPGERARGVAVGMVTTPWNADGDCEVTRFMAVVPWHGIAIPKRLRGFKVRVRAAAP